MIQKPVVVIEDDLMIREGLQEFLELENYQVRTAENGREGLEIVRALRGRCFVILDLQMPVMTGEEFLRALSQDPDPELRSELQKTPVLVLSARAAGFQHGGIVAFLKKPVDVDELLRTVAAHQGD